MNKKVQVYASIRKLKGIGVAGILAISFLGMAVLTSPRVFAEETALVATSSETSDSLSAAQTDLANAQEEVNLAQEKVEQLSNQAVQQEEIVSDTQADIEVTDQAIATTQEALAESKSKEESLSQEESELSQQISSAQDDVAQASQEVTDAQKVLETARQQSQKQTEEIENAQAEVNQAQEEITVSKAELDQAVSAANQANDKFEAAQEAQKKANDALLAAENNVSANKIVLTQAYMDALEKAYTDVKGVEVTTDTYNTIINKAAKETLLSEGKKLYQSNQFQADPSDDNTTLYDLNELPDEIIRDLSFYASELINSLNQQLGTVTTYVTPGSLAFADRVGDLYVEDNWTYNNAGHDVSAIKKAAAEFGLDSTGQYYENMFSSWTNIGPVKQMTLVQMKKEIYDSIKGFMFSGAIPGNDQQEWAHATGITNSGNMRVQSGVTNSYVGVDFNYLSDGSNRLHFLSVVDSPGYIVDPSKFNTTILTPASKTEKLQAAFEKAKQDLAAAENEVAQAQANLTEKETAYQASSKKLEEAKVKLDALKATSDQDVANAQTLLDKAQENLTVKENLLSDLKNQKAALDAKLQKQTSESKQLESELSRLQTVQAEQKQSEAIAKAVLENINNELVAAKTALQKAEENLSQKELALSNAQTAAKAKAEEEAAQAAAKAKAEEEAAQAAAKAKAEEEAAQAAAKAKEEEEAAQAAAKAKEEEEAAQAAAKAKAEEEAAQAAAKVKAEEEAAQAAAKAKAEEEAAQAAAKAKEEEEAAQAAAKAKEEEEAAQAAAKAKAEEEAAQAAAKAKAEKEAAQAAAQAAAKAKAEEESTQAKSEAKEEKEDEAKTEIEEQTKSEVQDEANFQGKSDLDVTKNDTVEQLNVKATSEQNPNVAVARSYGSDNTTAKHTLEKTSYNKQTEENQVELPETGDETSQTLLLSGLLMMTLAIFSFKKQKD
ncbi:SEC10/PgrA surface exclusion domain-containing protein [Streptococcus loxodontisalivarius]|uniref:SEC10/PgrA surface exclusion-like protein/LPXTG-motif cell wall-anchored protein n=1 Tax=Streptococcus loxodontisalivarius TaxID=1349415 RepID=A0ABS2PWX4_9STRE|nr:SEC10/PgrA surface exclusion domain-containing protein [Streptococcus loxodontisalivarius]MBM7643792.1 SEC10/PgrA surface exclusion-like protein/LPXTG-motif cell wall-anchored protein [Streptococcus loxodontisalivarius]